MAKERTRDPKRGTKPVPLSNKFVPEFFTHLDHRTYAAQEIQRRYHALRDDVGVDSEQKDILVRRAVFIALRLETLETKAARCEEIDVGVYTQMVNSLLGLLKTLGLERKPKKVDLKAYIRGDDP